MAIDIMNDWDSSSRPKKLMDKRAELPHHKRLKWSKRKLSDIEGLCIHQTLGGDNPVATANYHINHFNNGSSKPGAPTVCYSFYIRKSGDIWWCNDLEDKTWSQGTSKIPGDENKKYLSIVVGGKFDGTGFDRGNCEPTLEQMSSLLELVRWLCLNLDLNYDQVHSHADFGKPACPGYKLSSIIDAINKDPSRRASSWSDKDWQYALVRLGYDLGDYGPNHDGIDGMWGHSSTVALKKFQESLHLSYISGIQDGRTKQLLISALKEKFGNDVSLKAKV